MIQLFGISKEYQRGKPILSDVSLHIEKGEFVFLTGPSGTGKTTLLRLIFCAEAPTQGRIVLMGKNVAKIQNSSIPFIRRNIGVVFQDYKLLTNQTVFDNVALALDVLGTDRRITRKKVSDILRGVGLYDKKDSYPLQLSGGEQQRVSIARALVNEPSILLADEPTGNLDEDNTAGIMELFSQANARGTTILMATHDRSLFRATSRRVLQLAGGRVVFDSHARATQPEAEASTRAGEDGNSEPTTNTNAVKPATRLPFLVRAKQEPLPLAVPHSATVEPRVPNTEEPEELPATLIAKEEEPPGWVSLKPEKVQNRTVGTKKKTESAALTGDLFSQNIEEHEPPGRSSPSEPALPAAKPDSGTWPPPFDGKLGRVKGPRKRTENFKDMMHRLSASGSQIPQDKDGNTDE